MRARANDNAAVPLRVIGIDPGSRICGYGIVDRTPGSAGYVYIASGRIELTPTDPLSKRLSEIYEALTGIIREFGPVEAAIERVFFAKSVQSALTLGHARGVSMLAATVHGINVHEYSALQVKKALVGYGRAEKTQVQAMVRAILNIRKTLSPDSADALALTICHLNSIQMSLQTQAVAQPRSDSVRTGRKRQGAARCLLGEPNLR